TLSRAETIIPHPARRAPNDSSSGPKGCYRPEAAEKSVLRRPLLFKIVVTGLWLRRRIGRKDVCHLVCQRAHCSLIKLCEGVIDSRVGSAGAPKLVGASGQSGRGTGSQLQRRRPPRRSASREISSSAPSLQPEFP